ncbi:hypothetical protein SUGI_1512500 [Cryptomeria japonica]|uniref:Uncharacterized protein n=1 Tax=Cryptomeria japonica TaxID=3369 RepID=A0AAD3NTP0_CRYJA|nr:hypothetical protein SUGI_1512500 [Cryptomeria japonica]
MRSPARWEARRPLSFYLEGRKEGAGLERRTRMNGLHGNQDSLVGPVVNEGIAVAYTPGSNRSTGSC